MERCGHATLLGTLCKNSINCHLHSVEKNTCSICLSVVRKTRGTRALPCGHLFHTRCIERWKTRCSTCPMCRKRFDVPVYRVSIIIENTSTSNSQAITINSSNIHEIFEQLDVSTDNDNTRLYFDIENIDDLETLLADLGFDDTIISVR